MEIFPYLRRLLALGFIAALLPACAPRMSDKSISPAPTSELDLEIIGRHADAPVRTSELAAILSSTWSDPLTLVSEKEADSAFTVSTCDALLEKLHERPDLQAENAADRAAFLYRTNTCLAADALSKANPSRITYVRSLPLDTSAAGILPSELAFATSQEYTERLKQYRGKALSAVFLHEEGLNPVALESLSPYRIRIRDSAGGEQEMSILGFGDFNRDGFEDLLLMVQNTIDGASYYASSLYQLTSKGGRPLQVLHSYKLLQSEE